jgi:hypothetical protein
MTYFFKQTIGYGLWHGMSVTDMNAGDRFKFYKMNLKKRTIIYLKKFHAT